MQIRVGLVAFVGFRQQVVPDFCSRAIFVGNFADVCAFGVVWVRWMRVVFGGGRARVPGGVARVGRAHGWCRSG